MLLWGIILLLPSRGMAVGDTLELFGANISQWGPQARNYLEQREVDIICRVEHRQQNLKQIRFELHAAGLAAAISPAAPGDKDGGQEEP